MYYGQDLSEDVISLNIYTQTPQVIYSITVPTITENDILQITGQFEATNPYSYNAMISSTILLADTSTTTTGVLIDAATSFNITPNMHHGVVIKSRSWQAPQNYTNKCINFVAHSGADTASPGDLLIIEQMYGHLDVVIIINNS